MTSERIKPTSKEKLSRPVKVLSWAGIVYGAVLGSIPVVLISIVGVYAANRMGKASSH